MEEFARLVGVSRATVSRAINNHPRVAPETKEKIRAAMEQYQYWPNGLARGLVTKRSGMVGIVTAGISAPYHAALVQAIANELYEWSYMAIFAFTGGIFDREREFVRMLKERRVDGLLVSPMVNERREFENAELVNQLRVEGTPIVLVDRYFRDSTVDCVIHDLYGAARQAVEHLVSLGHRRIGYICTALSRRSIDGRLTGDDRLEGYRGGLADAGIPFDENLVVDTRHSIDGGYEGARRLLEVNPRPTAIFCYSDLLAIGVLHSLHDAGVKVPEEMSIVGCDDSDMAARAEIPLTTMRLAKEDMGRQAVRMLVEKINAEGADKEKIRHIVLPAELVMRESTAGVYLGG